MGRLLAVNKTRPAYTQRSVMAFGDSITEGSSASDEGGYRSRLFALAVAARKPFRFVGPNSMGPATVNGVPFPSGHSGWSGYTMLDTPAPTPGIGSKLPSPALAYGTPDIILLHISVNDMILYPAGNAGLATRMGTLLDLIVRYAPQATIVLAQNTPQTYAGAQPVWDAFVATYPAIIAARVALGQSIIGCDMRGITAGLTGDGLHPNDSGYSQMAAIWWAAIVGLL